MRTSRISAVAVTLAAAIGIAACGSSSSSSSSSGNPAPSSGGSSSSSSSGGGGSATLNGAGSTLAAPIYQQWGSTLKSQGLTVNFNPVGSGAGIASLQTATVNFAGSDPALKPTDEKAMKGPVLQFPVAFGAITVSYNLPGIKSGLKLDGPTVADIFLGKIKTWSDPAIAKLNPGMKLPSTNITVVHRSDSSGTTAGLHHVPYGRQSGVEVSGRFRQDGQVAHRHRCRQELGRRRGRQADPGFGRLRRAGLRAGERLHLRVDQERRRQLRDSDDRQHLGGRRRNQDPG